MPCSAGVLAGPQIPDTQHVGDRRGRLRYINHRPAEHARSLNGGDDTIRATGSRVT